MRAKENLRVRLGRRTYVVERPFGSLPGGLGTVSDVAVGRNGHVFALLRRDPLLSEAADAVVVLDREGFVLGSWGSDVADAHMLFADPESGEVVVVDRDAHQLRRYTEEGTLLGTVGGRHCPGEPFGHPTDVTRMPDGRWAVSDGYGHAQVHLFTAAWSPLRSFGALGTEPGQFLSPHSVAPLGPDRLVVVDRENHRLQVFSSDGRIEAVWSGFFRPQSVWVDPSVGVFVTDSIPSLSLVTPDGERLGRCRPVLNGAHGLCGDQETGVLYLAEGTPSRLTRLLPSAGASES